jgi:hypothetical protein
MDSYAAITALAPGKPLMLGEFASAEKLDGGAAKAAWIQNALTNEIPSMPAIRAICWFDWDVDPLPGAAAPSGVSWPIETSSAAQAAFGSSIKSSRYLVNTFSNLKVAQGSNPIPPHGGNGGTGGGHHTNTGGGGHHTNSGGHANGGGHTNGGHSNGGGGGGHSGGGGGGGEFL